MAVTDLSTIMAATNLFGRGFADTRARSILAAYPDILTSQRTPETKIANVASVEGIAELTAQKFVDGIPRFVEFADDISYDLTTVINPTLVDTNHPLSGQRITMTGFRDKQLTSDLSAVGAIIGSTVGSTTAVVIVATDDDRTGLSGKLKQARTHNVPIMSRDEFIVHYKLN